MLEFDAASADALSRRLDAVLRQGAESLAAAGVDAPLIDARRLLSAATGCSAADLIAHPEQLVGASEIARFAVMIARRCRREPVSRILGEREFYGRTFRITPAVLDPRADSETLIDEALSISDRKDWRQRPIRILDIGTGSGALLITLLAELPLATGLGTDVSLEALAVAVANAEQNSVAARATFTKADALEGIAGPFDLVVSNPPYIASDDIAGLAPEVRGYDPHGALDGGPDGLDVYRKIIPQLARVLPCGVLLLEVGAGQASAVSALLAREFSRAFVRTSRDLGGHERCVAMEIQL
jgi:release factor glutamine methyltransferase